MRKSVLKKYLRAYWAFGLFALYAFLVLLFDAVSWTALAEVFGLVLVATGAMAWLVNDYVKDSDNRVQEKLEEISDLLAPYDGMKLKDMPPDIQAEVCKRLGWTELTPKK